MAASLASASMQLTPGSAKLVTPRQLVVTTARPDAIASITGIPQASYLPGHAEAPGRTLVRSLFKHRSSQSGSSIAEEAASG